MAKKAARLLPGFDGAPEGDPAADSAAPPEAALKKRSRRGPPPAAAADAAASRLPAASGVADSEAPFDVSAATSASATLATPSTANPSDSASPAASAANVHGDSPSGLPLAGKRVWVLDAPSLIFQVFHAIGGMTGPRGEPVNAVYGLSNDLQRIRREHKPDYLFAAFDTSAPTFRDGLYDEYKSHREAMPEDLSQQWPLLRELVECLGVPIVELDGFEADDVLATIAYQAESLGAECILVTGDKDCRQLLTDKVKIFHIRKNLFFDAAALAADWGVTPEQVTDFQGLVGDPVDHIPGVPQIGPKTAKQLLDQFHTLEGVLAGASTLPPSKKRDNLIQFAEQARLSKILATLDRQTPIEIPWSAATGSGLDPVRAYAFFERVGFKRLADEMRSRLPPEPPPPWNATYKAVTTAEELAAVCAELAAADAFAVDTETTGLHPRDSELVGISVALAGGRGWYLPLKAPEGDPVLPLPLVHEMLGPLLADAARGKRGQNLKFDLSMLRSGGFALAGLQFDSMLASYLLDPGRRTHNLDDLSRTHLRHETIKIESLIGTGKNQKRMDEAPLAAIAEYAAEDADVAWRLSETLRGRLQETGLQKLFDELEMPLVEVLADLEYEGVFVESTRLAALSAKYGERLADLEKEIHTLAGREFNIQSPKQLQTILFEELKLPIRRKVQTGASTDADVLEELAPLHPLPAKIVEYREFAKLKNTYVDAFPAMISPKTGRIHASFNQNVAATGRLSSSNPNLQNIPIRTTEGREIRSAFRPQLPGWSFVCADYSQIELRVLAHFTGDPNLSAAFHQDHDVHAMVAAQIYGVPLAEVTKDQRRRAKTVNFGVIYGQTPWGLARELGISNAEAETFIEEYFARYPTVDVFLKTLLAEAREKGFVQTLLGRRRPVDGIRPDPGRQKNLAERMAANTVVQGTAADVIKAAMVRIHRLLKEKGLRTRMVLQIHDELVFETPEEELAVAVPLVREAMSQVIPLAVPLKVDVSVGDSWLDAEPVAP